MSLLYSSPTCFARGFFKKFKKSFIFAEIPIFPLFGAGTRRRTCGFPACSAGSTTFFRSLNNFFIKPLANPHKGVLYYLQENKKVLIVVFFITMVQRFALFAATWFVYLAFGLKGTSAFTVILLQGSIAVAVDMLPLPGGMGISEKIFLDIFLPVFGSMLLLPGMVLSRGLGYYTELILSAIFTIVANFTIGRKKKSVVEKC